ncbi:MAG: hypothetical protein KZQ58_12125 [gamma proteobacterium symbiont of Bathyaustriella thionipta]|nr:hypothetical protein [gamma proteobacterium symbiont of Bathyaustriella thionipta]
MNDQSSNLLSNNTVILICVAIGLFLLGIASGLIPTQAGTVHAPMWVILVCGIVFLLTAAMIFVGTDASSNDLFATLFLASMGSVGIWVAFFSNDEGFSGGLAFLPEKHNLLLTRTVFAGGALLAFALAVYAIRRYLRNSANKQV